MVVMRKITLGESAGVSRWGDSTAGDGRRGGLMPGGGGPSASNNDRLGVSNQV